MNKYFSLAIGGAVGTVFRYIISNATYSLFQSAIFPFGTLLVNLSGSFIIGLLAGLNEANLISPGFRTFLFIGVLGGYTTFSSFSIETLNLIRAGEIRFAIINLTVSNVVGIGLAFGGFFLSRYILNSFK